MDVKKLLELPDNIKAIWNSAHVSVKDKKRILRCLIEDVTMTREGTITRLGVRFKGGTSTVVECINPPKAYTLWTTSDEVLDIMRKESEYHTAEEISQILISSGFKTGFGRELTAKSVLYLQRNYKIPTYKDHLRDKGYLTTKEKALQLKIEPYILYKRKKQVNLKVK